LITDNPVSITHTAGAAVPCYVKSSMKTTIKCLLDTKNVVKKEGDTGTMVTFLKTSEEPNVKNQTVIGHTLTKYHLLSP